MRICHTQPAHGQLLSCDGFSDIAKYSTTLILNVSTRALSNGPFYAASPLQALTVIALV